MNHTTKAAQKSNQGPSFISDLVVELSSGNNNWPKSYCWEVQLTLRGILFPFWGAVLDTGIVRIIRGLSKCHLQLSSINSPFALEGYTFIGLKSSLAVEYLENEYIFYFQNCTSNISVLRMSLRKRQHEHVT